MTMITNTNIGSVKCKLSRYLEEVPHPYASAMNRTSTNAQKPKTASTSPSKCQTPAWAVRVCATCSKYRVEKVCNTASANKATPVISREPMLVGIA
jgi:hypothetical protein